MEIQHNGVWGTVCDDFWDEDDATVVCHQLGFFGDATALQGSQFGQGERGENRHCLTFGELAYFFPLLFYYGAKFGSCQIHGTGCGNALHVNAVSFSLANSTLSWTGLLKSTSSVCI